jgi:hypothetical protein
LSQNTLAKPLSSQALLSFSMTNIDRLFPGFTLGDFAALYGLPTILPLSLFLSVKAQLPTQLGGLDTNVAFIDGGNTFKLYRVSRLAQLHQLDPRQVLEGIFISRAFTAHQMTSLVFEKLEETVNRLDSKLVIISDIAGLYLDKDVPAAEAKEVYNQLTTYLSKLAEEKQIIIIATLLPHPYSRRNTFMHAATCGRANVVASIRPSQFGQEFVLEKHPVLGLGYARFPSPNLTLNEFMEN